MSAGLAEEGRDRMRRWYIETGQPWLERRLAAWSARAGCDDVGVDVRDLGYRWGSVRPTEGSPRINVHWATLQLPPSLIDYVLVHELAHLTETNHTPEYWTIVGRLMPGYEATKGCARLHRQERLARPDPNRIGSKQWSCNAASRA